MEPNPIVMVDDNETDRLLARTCYKRTGRARPFVTLNSGEALLEYMGQVIEGLKPMPALVLLDINMPRLDGFETLRRLRARPEFKQVPVITMFSHSDRPDDQLLSEGAARFQTKPFEIAEYVEMLRGLETIIDDADSPRD